MTLTLPELMARRHDDAPDDRHWPTPGQLAAGLDPLTRQTPALEAIDQLLVDVADTPGARAMVFVSFQEGKTDRAAIAFVLWLLEHNKNLRVAIVSYGREKARDIGQAIRDKIANHPDQLQVRLRPDSKAAGRFKVAGYRGGVYCTSIGGSLTGWAVDVLIIDDPHKDLDEAISATHRARVWRWWQGTAVPRMSPQTRTVLIQTRWHEDDLAGRLLASNPGPWRVLSIPAVAESPDDPLGRQVGEGMKSARGDRDWDAIRKDVGEYVWAAAYQQRPAPAEGGLFKRASIRHWAEMPIDHGVGRRLSLDGRPLVLADTWKFLTVDLAASTKTRADYTVAGVFAVSPDGDLVLIDGIRKRIVEADHWPHIRGLREKHSGDVVYVEATQHSTTMAYEAGRSGIPLVPLVADKDKWLRALPAAARADSGRLWLPPVSSHPWVQEWVDELAAFNNGAHDDVVDVVAYAARVAAADWVPQPSAAEVDAMRAAHRESTTSGVDLMTVDY